MSVATSQVLVRSIGNDGGYLDMRHYGRGLLLELRNVSGSNLKLPHIGAATDAERLLL